MAPQNPQDGKVEGQMPAQTVALSKYDTEKYIVLSPPAAVQTTVTGYGLTVVDEAIKVSADYDDKEIYKVGSRGIQVQGRWQSEDMVSFTNPCLSRFANAGAINMGTRRIDDRSDPWFVEFQAMGAIKRADGSALLATRTKSLELKDIEIEVRMQQEAKVADLVQNKKVRQEDFQREVEDRVNREMLGKRKNRVALCETGAVLRVIRAMLGIRSSYPISEIRDKVFIVRRLDFRPDARDPEVKAALIQQGMRAVGELYAGGPGGGWPELPQGGSDSSARPGAIISHTGAVEVLPESPEEQREEQTEAQRGLVTAEVIPDKGAPVNGDTGPDNFILRFQAIRQTAGLPPVDPLIFRNIKLVDFCAQVNRLVQALSSTSSASEFIEQAKKLQQDLNSRAPELFGGEVGGQ